jgi:hypothetical protein
MTEQFIQGRKYLKAVTPKTLIWYKCSLAAFNGAIGSRVAINQRIVELRDRGVSLDKLGSFLLSVP